MHPYNKTRPSEIIVELHTSTFLLSSSRKDYMGGEWWPWIVVLFGMIARADLNYCSLSLSLHHTVGAVVLLS